MLKIFRFWKDNYRAIDVRHTHSLTLFHRFQPKNIQMSQKKKTSKKSKIPPSLFLKYLNTK
jgi:hypothetical protein